MTDGFVAKNPSVVWVKLGDRNVCLTLRSCSWGNKDKGKPMSTKAEITDVSVSDCRGGASICALLVCRWLASVVHPVVVPITLIAMEDFVALAAFTSGTVVRSGWHETLRRATDDSLDLLLDCCYRKFFQMTGLWRSFHRNANSTKIRSIRSIGHLTMRMTRNANWQS